MPKINERRGNCFTYESAELERMVKEKAKRAYSATKSLLDSRKPGHKITRALGVSKPRWGYYAIQTPLSARTRKDLHEVAEESL